MNKFTVGEVSFAPFPTSGRASLALFTSSFHNRFLFLKEVYLSRQFCCNPKVFDKSGDKISSMSKKLSVWIRRKERPRIGIFGFSKTHGSACYEKPYVHPRVFNS